MCYESESSHWIGGPVGFLLFGVCVVGLVVLVAVLADCEQATRYRITDDRGHTYTTNHYSLGESCVRFSGVTLCGNFRIEKVTP